MRDAPASAAEDVGGGLRRAPWTLTAWRLLVRPNVHPWLPGWRHGQASSTRIALASLAVLLLLAWLASGCTSVAPIISQPRVALDQPAGGAVCETVKAQAQELRISSRDERFVLSFDRVPTVDSAVARLSVTPPSAREAAVITLGDTRITGDTFPVAGPGITLTLAPANGKWPSIPSMLVELEVTAPFHLGDSLTGFLRAALDDAARLERRFEQQSNKPASGVSDGLARKIDELTQQLSCRADSLKAAVDKVRASLDALDAVRAAIYAEGRPGFAEGERASKAWAEAREAVSAAAREAKVAADWPRLEQSDVGLMRFSAEHVAQLAIIARDVKEPKDQEEAVRWLAFALAPEAKVNEQRQKLPPLRSIADAAARQAFRTVARATPLHVPLAVSLPPERDWLKSCAALAPRRPGDDDDEPRRETFAFRLATVQSRPQLSPACYGDAANAVVPNQAAAASALREWLGMRDGIVLRNPDQIAAASARAQCARRLLCGDPLVNADPLFTIDPSSASLAPVRERLAAVREATPAGADLDPAVKNALDAGAGRLFCATAGDPRLTARVKTVSQYRQLVAGARDLFAFAPDEARCDVAPAKVRARLRERWVEIVSTAGRDQDLCPSLSGVCPKRIADKVQALFGLPKGRLASPVEQGAALEYPPPFGFTRSFVDKVRRCRQCEELDDVRRGIPGGDLAGEECPVEGEEKAVQGSLEIGPPGDVQAIDLPGCDLSVPVPLKLKLKRGAGRVVSVLSPRPFKLNNVAVSERRLHAQLGWAYVTTGDIDDQALFAGREARLLPSEPDQKFYFLSLRSAAY